jgi:hypothetical protein
MRFWDPEEDERRRLAKKGAVKAKQQSRLGFDEREMSRRAKKYARRLIERRMLPRRSR